MHFGLWTFVPIFECSHKYKNLNTKFCDLGLGGRGSYNCRFKGLVALGYPPYVTIILSKLLTSNTLAAICKISGFQHGAIQPRKSAEKQKLAAICHKTKWCQWINSKNIWGAGCQTSAPVLHKQWSSESKRNPKHDGHGPTTRQYKCHTNHGRLVLPVPLISIAM